MPEIMLVIEPTSLLVMNKEKAGSKTLNSVNYIPGAVIRGALAEYFIALGKSKDIAPFVSKIRFGNFFPSPSRSVVSLPFPISAMECKKEPGFCNVPKKNYKEKGHGIRDTLIPAMVYYQFMKEGIRMPVPFLFQCSKCGSRMEQVGGFYVHLPEGWKKVAPKKIIQTKTALSRYRRTSQKGLLYRVVSLRPEGCFVGRIWCEDGNEEIVIEAVEKMGIGALISKGMGEVRVVKNSVSLPSVKERLEEFNRTVREVWEDMRYLLTELEVKNIPEFPEGVFFSVDLLSPAILKDENKIPTLKLILKYNNKLIEPIYWTTRPALAGGWSTAWGLPKPTDLAASQGSSYVFLIKDSMVNVVKYLEKLEEDGIGEKTDEGMGEIIICHTFHKEVNPI